jgi:hypothetical protein
MPTKTARRAPRPAKTRHTGRKQQGPPQPVPTWLNTHPRGNPEVDARDLERSRERLETLLGR